MTSKLRVPCAYQGGKQRIAKQIVDLLLDTATGKDTVFYDLCCGSGAISIELVNRGISPENIVMLDRSSWGAFWYAIGSGFFDINFFDDLLSELPVDKKSTKSYMEHLREIQVGEHEAEIYILLQACSFGGKQIWWNGTKWENAFFRDYWEPTATSIRRSPANPMQPSAMELRRRIYNLTQAMRGIHCIKEDISSLLSYHFPEEAVVYVDPPYAGTTGYAFGFDVCQFVSSIRRRGVHAPLFVSESIPLNDNALQLQFGGAKGGISGTRIGKHQEWISRF